jgi:hypothetical protein
VPKPDPFSALPFWAKAAVSVGFGALYIIVDRFTFHMLPTSPLATIAFFVISTGLFFFGIAVRGWILRRA